MPPCPKLELGRCYHYKHPEKIYEIVGIARHSETLEPLVVYRALYGDHSLWARPYEMFVGNVVCDGQPRARFVRIP